MAKDALGYLWLSLLARLMPVLLFAPAAPSAAQESWTPTSTVGAPSARYEHTAVWTGSKMIVWGGNGLAYTNTGGIYDPATDSWTATNTAGAPSPRGVHTAVWTGSKMIIWGGLDSSVGGSTNTGGIYDPAADSWTAVSTVGAPSARARHAAVWTGSRMIVWGGAILGVGYTDTGGIYDPSTNSWTAMSTTGAPSPRFEHTAVWTGSKMIVWGGWDPTYTNAGGLYDPATDSWTATSTTGAPTPRSYHTAVWTGSRMIIWSGGVDGNPYTDTGGVYNPAGDSWTSTSTAGAPAGREWPTAVWTGARMIIWGGLDGSVGGSTNTGGIYDPATDSWTATTTTGAPTARGYHTAVWTGSDMIVWGGYPSGPTNTGGIYSNPAVVPPPPPPATFYTVTPCRVADTRNAAGPTGGPALVAGATRSFPVTGGACGIPPTAIALSVNVTAVGAAARGYLTLYPGDAASPPPTSNINFSAGQTRANNAIILLATSGGTIDVRNGSAGSLHFVLDVNGFFASGGGPDVTITITGMSGATSFSPNPAAVKVGQNVAWHNVDSIGHTATQDGGGFDTGVIPPGGTSAPIKLSTSGTMGYHCAIHPSMVGTLNITP